MTNPLLTLIQMRLRRREQRGHHPHPRPRRQGRRRQAGGLHRVLRGGSPESDGDGGGRDFGRGSVTAIVLNVDASGN